MTSQKAQMNGAIIFGVFVITALLGIIIMMLGFDVVDASHEGVQVQLGKITGIQSPGIMWTGLFTHVYSYDMRTRKEQVDLSGLNSAVDKTGQAVYATINVNYRIKPDRELVKQLYSNVGPDSVIADRMNLKPIIIEGFKQAASKYDALEIIEKRQEVKDLAKENIKKNFPTTYFEIQDIVITNIDFTPDFKAAIEQKKIAEQNSFKEKNQLQVVIYQQQQEIERSKAGAVQMELQKNQITPMLLTKIMLEKWDGHYPQYLIMPPTGTNAFIQLPTMSTGG